MSDPAPADPTTSVDPYSTALTKIDAAHALDPNIHTLPDGTTIPYELHYAQKCTAWLEKRAPDASPALRLAIRAQHFRRWEVPRATYPMTRIGYHTWRTHLKRRQAQLVESIMDEAGFGAEMRGRVAALMRKEDLKSDEESQVLEDVACLVFLDDQFEKFEREHDEEKILGILRKTWGKMTERGHELALGIPMSARPQELVQKAWAGA